MKKLYYMILYDREGERNRETDTDTYFAWLRWDGNLKVLTKHIIADTCIESVDIKVESGVFCSHWEHDICES